MIEDYWESSKKMLADSDFLKSPKEYDKDNISPDIIIKIRPYVVILLIKLQPALSFVLLKSFVVHERYCTYVSFHDKNISFIQTWFSYICWARYISNPDFEPTKIVTVSKAAFGLCSWIGAVEAYDRAPKIVAPKVAALKATEAEYNEVMGQLAVK